MAVAKKILSLWIYARNDIVLLAERQEFR